MWSLKPEVTEGVTRWLILNAAGEIVDSWRWHAPAAEVVAEVNATWARARQLEAEWFAIAAPSEGVRRAA